MIIGGAIGPLETFSESDGMIIGGAVGPLETLSESDGMIIGGAGDAIRVTLSQMV